MLILNVIGLMICAAVIFYSGRKLSYYGDIIATQRGWGKLWAGLILLATVTSLPELMVGISSAAWVQSADLATGDVLGSCAFNLGILAMLDVFVAKPRTFFSTASQNHILAAVMGIILLAMTGLGIFLPAGINITPWISIMSILFFIVYMFSIRLIYQLEKKTRVHISGHPFIQTSTITFQRAVKLFILFALVTVTAALLLPYFTEKIALATGIGESFAGTLFLAAATSLPEIAISIAAVRMGAIDLAAGNLFGSNIFNILILGIDDLFYTKGQLLKDASDANLVSVFATIIMSAIAIAGLIYRSDDKRYKLAWDSAFIFLVYIINLIILYQLTGTN